MKSTNKNFALIGFACDEGVRRNNGRPGAKDGPKTFRKALENLSIEDDITLFDLGDITCSDGDLERASYALSLMVGKVRSQNMIPIVIGGGHELAYGQYTGLHTECSIVNFDAHYDLRPLLEGGKGNSGTPFNQIAIDCQSKNTSFDYTCIGIQPLKNSEILFKRAEELNVTTLFADDVKKNPEKVTKTLKNIIKKKKPIYLSICLDVFAQSEAPGVSAPQELGLPLASLLPHIKLLTESGLVIALGIAELNPLFDQDGRTAQLATKIFKAFIDN